MNYEMLRCTCVLPSTMVYVMLNHVLWSVASKNGTKRKSGVNYLLLFVSEMQPKVNSTASGSVPWPWRAPQISTFPAQKIISSLLLEEMPTIHEQKQLIIFLCTHSLSHLRRTTANQDKGKGPRSFNGTRQEAALYLMWFCQQCVVTLPCIWYKVVWITFRLCRTTYKLFVMRQMIYCTFCIPLYHVLSTTLCLLMNERRDLFSLHVWVFFWNIQLLA